MVAYGLFRLVFIIILMFGTNISKAQNKTPMNVVGTYINSTKTIRNTSLVLGIHTNIKTNTSVRNTTGNLTKCDPLWPYLKFRAVIDIPVVGLLCILGLAGNTASILVWRKDGIYNNVKFLLQALALADNAYLVTCFLFQTMRAINECTSWMVPLKYVLPYMEPFIWPCASIAQTMSQWLVILVTSERYMAVCVPLRKRCYFTNKTVQRITYTIPIAAVLYNIPRFFELEVAEKYLDCIQETRLVAKRTSLRENKMYYLIYKTIFFFLFRFIIPMSVLLVFNSRLIQTIHKARRNRELMTNRNMKANRTLNAMLATVVTIYIVCQMPDFILRELVTLRHFNVINLNAWGVHYTNTITNMLLTVNSSINCIIYCLTGSRFRKIFVRMFCRCCLRNCKKTEANQNRNSAYDAHPKMRLQATSSNRFSFKSMKKISSCETYSSYIPQDSPI